MSAREQWREAWKIARLVGDDAPDAFNTFVRLKLRRTPIGVCALRLRALRDGARA